MKRINIIENLIDVRELLELAQDSPVLVVMPDGKEFVVALADDFDQEIAQLRQSVAFQAFLDTRSAKQRPRRSLAEVADEIDIELAAQNETDI